MRVLRLLRAPACAVVCLVGLGCSASETPSESGSESASEIESGSGSEVESASEPESGVSGESPPPGASNLEAAVIDSFPAPGFKLARLGGGEVGLESLRGKIVVLDFWATWCAPCEKSIPALNAFSDAYRDSGVEVYGISTDVDGAEVVAPWVAEREVRYPILIGDYELAQRFGALGLPVSYVLAPDGTVVDQHLGYIEVADLEHSLIRARSYWRAAQKLHN